jgi:uncharacterized membrane protein
MAFPRTPPYVDGVDNVGAATFNDLENRASQAITNAVHVFVGPTTPTPAAGFGEYVWMVTDGSGNLLDIQSGSA